MLFDDTTDTTDAAVVNTDNGVSAPGTSALNISYTKPDGTASQFQYATNTTFPNDSAVQAYLASNCKHSGTSSIPWLWLAVAAVVGVIVGHYLWKK